jgi:hypothetical protein
MAPPENNRLIDYLVIRDRDERKFRQVTDSRWGGLLEPAPGENPAKTDEGMRIALLCSWEFGYIVLETLKSIESDFPQKLNLVGLVTDDPISPDAKISVKKRIWSKLGIHEWVIDETSIIESALVHGTPVYTGEIKTGSFQHILQQWNPDAILVCVFGQLIDPYIISLPPYGIYNFHPSDLARNYGAGTAPYDDLAERHLESSVWTVHQVSEKIDSGHIVGQSPQICVLDKCNSLPKNPLVVYNRFAEALGPMVRILVEELYIRQERKAKGAIEKIDYPALYPAEIGKMLLKPIEAMEPMNHFLKPGYRSSH